LFKGFKLLGRIERFQLLERIERFQLLERIERFIRCRVGFKTGGRLLRSQTLVVTPQGDVVKFLLFLAVLKLLYDRTCF
jgi:hypothetical protein